MCVSAVQSQLIIRHLKVHSWIGLDVVAVANFTSQGFKDCTVPRYPPEVAALLPRRNQSINPIKQQQYTHSIDSSMKFQCCILGIRFLFVKRVVLSCYVIHNAPIKSQITFLFSGCGFFAASHDCVETKGSRKPTREKEEV